MNTEKQINTPAFPVATLGNGVSFYEPGMSKRFYTACMAMQGLLSNPNLDEWSIHLDNVHEKLAQSAYQYADELLKQEQL